MDYYITIHRIYVNCTSLIHDDLLMYTWYNIGKHGWYCLYCLCCAVACSNSDRAVSGKAFAWRLLGMMPSISRAATLAQSDEWRSHWRTRLYHSCIDILAQQINDLIGRDMFFRFGAQMYRCSSVFLDFLCMDGDSVSNAIMCPTTQCMSCWCLKDQLSATDIYICHMYYLLQSYIQHIFHGFKSYMSGS